LTIWKKNSQKTDKPERCERNIYTELKKEVREVRKQGALPDKATGSFGRYYCDLCNKTAPAEELRQCSTCGRWVCSDCFTPEYYLCNSCNGILKLLTLKDPGQ